MRGLLVGSERGLILEDFVEEELLRLGQRLVDLEGLHAGLALGLRQEALQDLDHGIDLAGLGFPEGRDDETIVDCMKIGHVSLLGERQEKHRRPGRAVASAPVEAIERPA